jgi:type IV pilus assembly protein PilP
MSAHKVALSFSYSLSIKLICIICLMQLTACGNSDFSDLDQYIADIKSKPKGVVKPLPEIKPVEPFIFKPEDLRDPFKPLKPAELTEDDASIAKATGIKPDTNRRKEELEAFPLESLKMVGTVNTKSGLWGLIKATDKTIFRVRVGNYMGQNYGKIIRLSTDKIELMEIIADKPGVWHEQPISISIEDSENKK